MTIDKDKYSQALQKNFGWTKEYADTEADRYNKLLEQGLTEPLLCYPDPDVENDKIRNQLIRKSTGQILMIYIYK